MCVRIVMFPFLQSESLKQANQVNWANLMYKLFTATENVDFVSVVAWHCGQGRHPNRTDWLSPWLKTDKQNQTESQQ